MKIRTMGGELFHTDGRTEMGKLIFAFLNSVNEPKNGLSLNVIKDTQSEITAQWFTKSLVEIFYHVTLCSVTL